MLKKKQFHQVFIVLILLSLIIFIVSPFSPFRILVAGIEKIVSPLQRSVYLNLGLPVDKEKDEMAKLREENINLKKSMVKMKTIGSDNEAFRDQFSTQSINTQKLIPVEIVGNDALLPGSMPTKIIIKVNENQNIKVGLPVVYKDILVGIIIKLSNNLASVSLTTNKSITFPVKTQETEALGIIKGEGNEMVLNQVVTSEKLAEGDLIVTKGNVDDKGLGFPPDLLVGKIVSIDKKPSALFQTAQVSPLINVNELKLLFIYLF